MSVASILIGRSKLELLPVALELSGVTSAIGILQMK